MIDLEPLEMYNQRGTGKTTALLNAAIDLAKLFPNDVLYVVHTQQEVLRLRRSVKDMPKNLKIVHIGQNYHLHGLPLTTSVIIDPYVLELRIRELEESNKKLVDIINHLVR